MLTRVLEEEKSVSQGANSELDVVIWRLDDCQLTVVGMNHEPDGLGLLVDQGRVDYTVGQPTKAGSGRDDDSGLDGGMLVLGDIFLEVGTNLNGEADLSNGPAAALTQVLDEVVMEGEVVRIHPYQIFDGPPKVEILLMQDSVLLVQVSRRACGIERAVKLALLNQ